MSWVTREIEKREKEINMGTKKRKDIKRERKYKREIEREREIWVQR